MVSQPSFTVADALVHVTADGSWFDTSLDASLDALVGQMDLAAVERACVTGAPGYPEPWSVVDIVKDDPRLEPVPCLGPTSSLQDPVIREKLTTVRAIKLHPRFGDFLLNDSSVHKLLHLYASVTQRPRVFICSYLYGGRPLDLDPVTSIHKLATRFPEVSFLILHGTGFSLLQLLQAVRALPNVYVDLSYALGELLEAKMHDQVRFALRRFQRRLIWGSDFPEVSVTGALTTALEVLGDLPDGISRDFLGNNLRAFMEWE